MKAIDRFVTPGHWRLEGIRSESREEIRHSVSPRGLGLQLVIAQRVCLAHTRSRVDWHPRAASGFSSA